MLQISNLHATVGGTPMLKGAIGALALGVVATALPASAEESSGSEQAYFDCYRQTLAAREYAAMTAAQLDEGRLEIAEVVAGRCPQHLDGRRRQADANVREAERVGRQTGDSALPSRIRNNLAHLSLLGLIAHDLDAVEPRMQGLAAERLRQRVVEAQAMAADPAIAADEAAIISGSQRPDFVRGQEVYGRCVTRNMVPLARTEAREDGIYDAARASCASLRTALTGGEKGNPMLSALYDQDDRRSRDEAPALVRALRAEPAASQNQE